MQLKFVLLVALIASLGFSHAMYEEDMAYAMASEDGDSFSSEDSSSFEEYSSAAGDDDAFSGSDFSEVASNSGSMSESSESSESGSSESHADSDSLTSNSESASVEAGDGPGPNAHPKIASYDSGFFATEDSSSVSEEASSGISESSSSESSASAESSESSESGSTSQESSSDDMSMDSAKEQAILKGHTEDGLLVPLRANDDNLEQDEVDKATQAVGYDPELTKLKVEQAADDRILKDAEDLATHDSALKTVQELRFREKPATKDMNKVDAAAPSKEMNKVDAAAPAKTPAKKEAVFVAKAVPGAVTDGKLLCPYVKDGQTSTKVCKHTNGVCCNTNTCCEQGMQCAGVVGNARCVSTMELGANAGSSQNTAQTNGGSYQAPNGQTIHFSPVIVINHVHGGSDKKTGEDKPENAKQEQESSSSSSEEEKEDKPKKEEDKKETKEDKKEAKPAGNTYHGPTIVKMHNVNRMAHTQKQDGDATTISGGDAEASSSSS